MQTKLEGYSRKIHKNHSRKIHKIAKSCQPTIYRESTHGTNIQSKQTSLEKIVAKRHLLMVDGQKNNGQNALKSRAADHGRITRHRLMSIFTTCKGTGEGDCTWFSGVKGTAGGAGGKLGILPWNSLPTIIHTGSHSRSTEPSFNGDFNRKTRPDF